MQYGPPGAGPPFLKRSLTARAHEVKIPALSLQKAEGRGRGTLIDGPQWFVGIGTKNKSAGAPSLARAFCETGRGF